MAIIMMKRWMYGSVECRDGWRTDGDAVDDDEPIANAAALNSKTHDDFPTERSSFPLALALVLALALGDLVTDFSSSWPTSFAGKAQWRSLSWLWNNMQLSFLSGAVI